MTRKEKVIKALELLQQGQELLDEAGFQLIFDSYNDDGAYAVPKDVDFPDDWGERDDLPSAGDFLSNCPIAIEISGLYNDGKRLVDNVPKWWKGWGKFAKP